MNSCPPQAAERRTDPVRLRRAATVAGVIMGMLAAVGLTAHRTSAAFTAKTSNTASTFGLGTVSLSTDLGGTALFTTADAMLSPTSPLTKCIQVRYTGTAASTVRLYATTPNSDPDSLGAQLTLTVDEGTGSAGSNCSGFSAGPQIYTGTLSSFVGAKNSYANGVGSWAPTSAENRMYRFSLTMSASAPANVQAAVATATFRWEARAGS